MRTVAHLHSKRPLVLCTKRGCRSSGRNAAWWAAPLPLPEDEVDADVAPSSPASPCCPGTQPSSAISWHPLHTPRLKVSGLCRNSKVHNNQCIMKAPLGGRGQSFNKESCLGRLSTHSTAKDKEEVATKPEEQHQQLPLHGNPKCRCRTPRPGCNRCR